MSSGHMERVSAFIRDLLQAQAAYTEAQTLGCSERVMKVLKTNMDYVESKLKLVLSEAR